MSQIVIMVTVCTPTPVDSDSEEGNAFCAIISNISTAVTISTVVAVLLTMTVRIPATAL